MSNNTSEPIMTGENYSIEYFENGKWKTIDAFQYLFFNSIGYLIASRESKDFDINFLGDKHQYVKGKYRLVKNYVMDKDTAPKTSHNLYFEFAVNWI